MKRCLKRAVSVTAAAVVACSCTVSTAGAGLVSALPEQLMTAPLQSGSTEPVPVIISLKSDAVMEGETDTDFLETAEAAEESATLERRQDAVIAKIRKLYPELEVRQRYTTLINGFSCTIPENLIGQVEELSAVSSVERTGNLQIEVEPESPFETPELPAYYDATGCTGEGRSLLSLTRSWM